MLPKIIDFWFEWNQLAYLEKLFLNGSIPKSIAKCKKCNKTSSLRSYTKEFFGIKIKQTIAENVDQNNFENNSELESIQNEKVKQIFRCQIWLNLADLENNLQWESCLATYWFDWLISWMLKNSTCPNWRRALTKYSIKQNKEWRKFFEILNEEKQKDPLWEVHNEETKIFWANWNMYIWSKCIISKNHNEHNLLENKQISEMLHKKAKNKISKWDSAINLWNNSIKIYDKSCELAETITKNLTNTLSKTLNSIWEEFNHENKQFQVEYKEKIKNIFEEWKENETVIEKYRDTKDLNLIPNVSKAFDKESILQSEVLEIIRKTDEQATENDLLCGNCTPFVNYFTTSLSEVLGNGIGFISWKIESENVIYLWFGKSEENEVDIIANFKNETDDKYYLSLEIEENKYWNLIDNEIKEFDFEQDQHVINKLQIKQEANMSEIDSEKIILKIFIWKVNEKLQDYKRNILTSFLDKIQKFYNDLNIDNLNKKTLSSDDIPNEKKTSIEIKREIDDNNNEDPKINISKTNKMMKEIKNE